MTLENLKAQLAEQHFIEKLERQLMLVRARKGQILPFIKLTKPDYKVNWHHRVIAKYIDMFIRKEIRFLMIFCPPRHGKSEMTSRRLPALLHGLYPNDEILANSYNSDLASSMTIDVQRIMDRPDYYEIFPTVRIMSEGKSGKWARTSNEHEILPWQDPNDRKWLWHRGSYHSAGVGGSYTGLGGNWILVDDPIKNREDADSPAFRKKLWDFWTNTLRTRLETNGSILITHTRWHKEDLAGKLIDLAAKNTGSDQFKILSFSAIKEGPPTEDDPRQDGEALWTDRFPLQDLEPLRIADNRAWAALYQQRPFEIGGNVIKGHWFIRYTLPPKIKYRMIYGDTAQKTREVNDYSVFACWGLGEDGKAYLLDLLRGKWEAPDLIRRAREFWAKQASADVERLGQLRQMKIEDKVSGTGLIQSLKRQEGAFPPIPVKGIERTKDKITRLLDVLPMMEAGLVCIPENASWINDFIEEHEAFTTNDSHAFDDQVDTSIDAVADLLSNSNKLNVWERAGQNA